MKKNILIIGLVFVSVSLTAFGIISATATPEKRASCNAPSQGTSSARASDLSFVFALEPRFKTTVSTEDIQTATSAKDLLPEHEVNSIESYENLAITQYKMGAVQLKEASPLSTSDLLTTSQKRLLQSLDCTNSFYISGKVKRKKKESEEVYYDTLIYYISVTPVSTAHYNSGNEAFVDYLKEATAKDIAKVDVDRLQPGKIQFTVSKDGTLKDIDMTHTCGYRKIDNKLLELVENTPGSWTPGTTSDGTPVDQQLVFFFGLKGC